MVTGFLVPKGAKLPRPAGEREGGRGRGRRIPISPPHLLNSNSCIMTLILHGIFLLESVLDLTQTIPVPSLSPALSLAWLPPWEGKRSRKELSHGSWSLVSDGPYLLQDGTPPASDGSAFGKAKRVLLPRQPSWPQGGAMSKAALSF